MAESNVLDQFNAIRDRVSSVSQPPVDNYSDKNTKYMQVPFEDETGKTPGLTGYSTSGPRSPQDFVDAYNIYKKTGKVKGFTFLEPGLQNDIRSTFNSALGPTSMLQRAAESYRQSPSTTTEDQLSSIGPEGRPAITAPAEYAAKTIGPALARSVSTPEGAAATVGGGIAASLSSGLSLPLQAGAVGLGTAAGGLAGDLATGTNQGQTAKRTGDFFLTAGLAAMAQGFTGVLKTVLGSGMSRRANEQVAGGMVDLLKGKYKQFSNDPHALEYVASTKDGANDLIQQGMKGLRADYQEISDGFVKNMKSIPSVLEGSSSIRQLADSTTTAYTRQKVTGTLGDKFVADLSTGSRALSKETAIGIKDYSKDLYKLGNDLLDSMGNAQKQSGVVKDIRAVQDKMRSIISDEFSKSSDAVKKTQLAILDKSIGDYEAQIAKFKDTAEVLHYMKLSVDENGFNTRLFQDNIRDKYMANRGSVMNEAGNIAARGGNLMQGGDKDVSVGMNWLTKNIPYINKIPLSRNIGESYIGKVRGTYPVSSAIGANAATIRSIDEYMKER